MTNPYITGPLQGQHADPPGRVHLRGRRRVQLRGGTNSFPMNLTTEPSRLIPASHSLYDLKWYLSDYISFMFSCHLCYSFDATACLLSAGILRPGYHRPLRAVRRRPLLPRRCGAQGGPRCGPAPVPGQLLRRPRLERVHLRRGASECGARTIEAEMVGFWCERKKM
jgi:hypothetical protein